MVSFAGIDLASFFPAPPAPQPSTSNSNDQTPTETNATDTNKESKRSSLLDEWTVYNPNGKSYCCIL